MSKQSNGSIPSAKPEVIIDGRKQDHAEFIRESRDDPGYYDDPGLGLGELEAMESINNALSGFNIVAKRRILDWICDLHKISAGPLRIKPEAFDRE